MPSPAKWDLHGIPDHPHAATYSTWFPRFGDYQNKGVGNFHLPQFDSIISKTYQGFLIAGVREGHDVNCQSLTSVRPLNTSVVSLPPLTLITVEYPSSSARFRMKQYVWPPQRKPNGKDDDEVSLRRVQSPICEAKGLDFRISSFVC